jgi:hypothetical protein
MRREERGAGREESRFGFIGSEGSGARRGVREKRIRI